MLKIPNDLNSRLIYPGTRTVPGFSRRHVPSAAWTPQAMIDAQMNFLWVNPSDLSTLFKDDRNSVIPVTTDGEMVGRLVDASGNGWDLQNADSTPPNGLIFHTSGGLYWLEQTGGLNGLKKQGISPAITYPLNVFAAVGDTEDAIQGVCYLIGSGGLHTDSISCYANSTVGGAPSLEILRGGAPTTAVGTPASGNRVLTFKMETGSQTVRVDLEAESASINAIVPPGLALLSFGEVRASGETAIIHEAIVTFGDITDEDRTNIVRYLASSQGRTL